MGRDSRRAAAIRPIQRPSDASQAMRAREKTTARSLFTGCRDRSGPAQEGWLEGAEIRGFPAGGLMAWGGATTKYTILADAAPCVRLPREAPTRRSPLSDIIPRFSRNTARARRSSLHVAARSPLPTLPTSSAMSEILKLRGGAAFSSNRLARLRSEEHTSELQSPLNLVC